MIFLTLEVLGISPLRKWTPEYDPLEDEVMEMFLVFCSSRFVTWGSVIAAKAHVVEFMRTMLGVVPPPFHGATYTAQKLRKPLAKERPNGRVTRTGFTVEEINAMFNIAINLIDNSGTRVEPPIGEVAITSVGFSEAEAHRALQHTRAHTGVK